MGAENLYSLLRSLAPPLSYELHKGQAGRILIIGGSEEYTGAPFYAGMSALKMGTDICHVICEKSAATVIKSYSPDLIVHPYLRGSQYLQGSQSGAAFNIFDIIAKCESVAERVHVAVIGPGLSRDTVVLQTVKRVLKRLKILNMPIVLDADGLFMVQEDPECIRNYQNAVLTPNVAEFRRLCEKMNLKGSDATAENLSRSLGVTVFEKGGTDVITDGSVTLRCDEQGSPRRCGGQGDVLAGTIAAFLAWGKLWGASLTESHPPLSLLACFGAATVTRRCSRLAFEKNGRSMTASDLVSAIPAVSSQLLEDATKL
ncbi:Ribokinase-like protein [Chytridium lagenaria]|nr:Ribokinase-like protein [Chytridium lagenaria]